MDRNFDLTKLTEPEARKLYAELAMQFGRPGSPSAQFTPDEELLWSAINNVIGAKRQLGDVLTRAGKEYTRAAFADDVEFVMTWLDRGCGRPVTRNQRLAIIQEGVECLARYVGRGGAPVIHKTMLQQLTKLPAAVDRAFPGYCEAGLLDRIAAIAVAA